MRERQLTASRSNERAVQRSHLREMGELRSAEVTDQLHPYVEKDEKDYRSRAQAEGHQSAGGETVGFEGASRRG